MKRVVRLERRSRAAPEGSKARSNALQWEKPVSFNEPLQQTFADSSCFVMARLDRLEKVADMIFEYRETMPDLFSGGAWSPGPGLPVALSRSPVSDSDSDEDMPAPLSPARPSSPSRPKAVPKAKPNPPAAKNKKKKAKTKDVSVSEVMGTEVWLVRHHMKDNTKAPKRKDNTFISVGNVSAAKAALDEVYGAGLCHSALCSIKWGNRRFAVCDCKGRRSHDLPDTSGPRDNSNWKRVLKLSKKAAT
jgi:hypothetical protein